MIADDSYIMTMFRLIGDADCNKIEGQGSLGPLMLQHGFSKDSAVWFTRNDKSKPASPISLFQEGYDVWLPNTRGTQYSRRHSFLDPDQDRVDYWDFSFVEFGLFDMPAFLEKIKTVNREEGSCKKITFVGHSQATISAFYGLSHAPYADRYLS